MAKLALPPDLTEAVSILSGLAEAFVKEADKVAEMELHDQLLGRLEDIQRQLNTIYLNLGSMLALVLDEINKLPVTILRNEIGGFVGLTKDSWQHWHSDHAVAEALLWKGDELFRKVVTAATIAEPPMLYTVVADLSMMQTVQAALANSVGSRLNKSDRVSIFNGYGGFFASTIGQSAGSIIDRKTALIAVRNGATGLIASLKPQADTQIGSEGSGGFRPAVHEGIYVETREAANLGQWRVEVAEIGFNFKPLVNRTISEQQLAGYLRDPGTIPSLPAAIAQHGKSFPDRDSVRAHAVLHQEAITIPLALIDILNSSIAFTDQVIELAQASAKVSVKFAAIQA